MVLADTTRSVRAWATKNRPHVHPVQGSLPHKMYLYWRRHSTKRIPQENLCHLVRVLVFWAPAFWLRNVLLAGPRVGRFTAPIIPTLATIAALGYAMYQWTAGFAATMAGLALSVWAVLGGVAFAIMCKAIVESNAETPREIRQASARALRRKKRMWVFWTSPIVAVALLVGAITLVLLLHITLVVPFSNYKIHRRIGRSIKSFLTVHPHNAKWLTPAWLGLVPVGYAVLRYDWAQWIVIAAAFLVMGVWLATTCAALARPHLRAAEKRALIDADRRKNLELERIRGRWRSLAGSEIFRLWLWQSDDRWSYFMRIWLVGKVTEDDLPYTFVQRVGDQDMARLENLFLVWILGRSETCHDRNIVILAPQRPHPRAAMMARLTWPLRKLAAAIWWLLRGIGQLAALIVAALWAAKIAKLCPLVQFRPARATDDTAAM
jgi:hypothetical protein